MQHHTELTLPEEGWAGQQGPPEASWKPLAWELPLPSPQEPHTSAQVEPEQRQRQEGLKPNAVSMEIVLLLPVGILMLPTGSI